LNNIKKILVIVQRSNGDVFFALSLIYYLRMNLPGSQIHILINDDTAGVLKLRKDFDKAFLFSYKEKHKKGFKYIFSIIKNIYKNYDLSINLTSSDRSVLFSILASKISISMIEKNKLKSWWKKIFLSKYYYYEPKEHNLIQILQPLNLLKMKYSLVLKEPTFSEKDIASMRKKLNDLGIGKFLIFHPSAQYEYKVYPELLRIKLLSLLTELNTDIIVTGGKTKIDQDINLGIPKNKKIHNFIGQTSLLEYSILSKLSEAYIGMDTLNMHIAASQNKKIFLISGPTNMQKWFPWSNKKDNFLHEIFQANMECVPCGKMGCNDNGESRCLKEISPSKITRSVSNFLNSNN